MVVISTQGCSNPGLELANAFGVNFQTASVPVGAIDYQIDTWMKGPFTYEITINEAGATISNSKLREYR